MKIRYSRLLLILAVFILIFASQVSASGDFELKIEPVSTEIFPDETAEYNITITNNLDHKETFVLSSNSKWFLKQSDHFREVPTNGSQSMIISVKPRVTMPLGKGYGALLRVEGVLSDIRKQYYLSLYLKSYESNFGEYVPTLNLYADFNSEVDPRERFNINLRFRNRNPRDIKNMNVIIHSDIFHKVLEESLPPLHEKSVQVSFDLNNDLPPKEHELEVKVNVGNKTYASLDDTFEIISYSDIQVEQVKEREFLRTITKIKAVNKGNSKGKKTVALQKNWIERIFLTASEDYEVSESLGNPVIEWTLQLEPNEEAEINVSNNYRLLAVIIIVILIAIYLYFSLRSELVVMKRAELIHKKHKKSEGSSLLKIKLFIRNRTSKKVYDVEVKERLSKLTEFIEEDSLGSAKPSKVIHGKKSTLVKWNFEDLEPYEERLITYKLRSKLKLVGSIQFPRALVRFRTYDGKSHVTGSDKPTLNFIRKRKKK